MTAPAPDVLSRLWVTQGWPHGFCPTHVFEPVKCNAACLAHRLAFAAAARELEREWPHWQRRKRLDARYRAPVEMVA